jgi:hypothetical protein
LDVEFDGIASLQCNSEGSVSGSGWDFGDQALEFTLGGAVAARSAKC